MKRLLLVFSLLAASVAVAQNRSADLDKAYEEARAAHNALKDAESRRDQGIEPQPGERIGTAGGGTRATDQYLARQQLLEQQVEVARQRYDAAMKRWNDLK